MPGGKPLGNTGSKPTIRELPNSAIGDALRMYAELSHGGKPYTKPYNGTKAVILPNGGFVGFRLYMTNSPNSIATIEVNIPGIPEVTKIKFNP